MGACCSCCCGRQPVNRAYLVKVSPRKSIPDGGKSTTVNPLQEDEKYPNGTTGIDGLEGPLVPIWAQQILPPPSFLKEDSSLLAEPQLEAPAVVVVEEPLRQTPNDSEDFEDDFDFELPELEGPAGDKVLEAKGAHLTLAPTKVEIIEIERELAHTPLPPGSDEETEPKTPPQGEEEMTEGTEARVDGPAEPAKETKLDDKQATTENSEEQTTEEPKPEENVDNLQ